MTERLRSFASDNYAGICPEAWSAMEEANRGHAPAYGDDVATARAADRVREIFEAPEAEVFFTFNGTAANSLALAHLCRSYEAVVCHRFSHVSTDECGAPEFFGGGVKLLLAEGTDGRISLSSLNEVLAGRRDLHFPRVAALSLTQATEFGTVYSLDELKLLTHAAKGRGLAVHMDGARFANGLVSLGCSPAEMTWKAGIDVLSLGGVKNGLPVGEAVVFFDRRQARDFDYRCKQAGQLNSKMRFVSGPWDAILREGAWLRHARHANTMAEQLAAGLRAIPGVELLFPRQANAVFVDFSDALAAKLHASGWHFYAFPGSAGHRLMCAWDTEESDITAFLEDVRELAVR